MIDGFMQIPWKRGGRSYQEADCWGVVYLWYRDVAGITIPSYSDMPGSNDADISSRDALISAESAGWIRTESPSKHDVVLLRTGGHTTHVGVMVDERHILHSEGPDGAYPVVEALTSPRIARRISGFYRHTV